MPLREATTHEEDFVPKAILLTGGAGFMCAPRRACLAWRARALTRRACSGSNVLLHLIKVFPNTAIVCYDKLDYCATLENIKEVLHNPRFFFIKGDSCDPDLVNFAMNTYKARARSSARCAGAR